MDCEGYIKRFMLRIMLILLTGSVSFVDVSICQNPRSVGCGEYRLCCIVLKGKGKCDRDLIWIWHLTAWASCQICLLTVRLWNKTHFPGTLKSPGAGRVCASSQREVLLWRPRSWLMEMNVHWVCMTMTDNGAQTLQVVGEAPTGASALVSPSNINYTNAHSEGYMSIPSTD